MFHLIPSQKFTDRKKQLRSLEADLDVREGHEVLGDMNYKLVHEGRRNVESIHGVVKVVPSFQSLYKKLVAPLDQISRTKI